MLKDHLVIDGYWPPQTFDQDSAIDYDEIMRQTLGWLARCDALYVVARSAGVDLEIDRARSFGLAIYTKMDQVPDIRGESSAS